MKYKSRFFHPWLIWNNGFVFVQGKNGNCTKGWRVRFGIFTGLLLALFFFGDITQAVEKKGEQPPLVTVETVAMENINPPWEYVGHVEAIQSVDLRARVKGFLEKVNFKEGSSVSSGDLLYILEQAPYQVRVDAAVASLARTKAAHIRADLYLQRVRTVLPGGVPETDVDAAVAEEVLTRTRRQEAESILKLSQLDLEYTRIKAPIDGRIGRTAFTKGNLLEPDSPPLSRIVQINPIRVVYSISENNPDLIKMALKDSLLQKKETDLHMLKHRIRMPSGEILKTTGIIDFLNNMVDPGTGTITVRAVFENPDGLLLPGQYVTILAEKGDGNFLPMVPLASLQEDKNGQYILVVNKKKQVDLRRITTGGVSGTKIAVKSGVTKGEKVIVQGLQKVRPGQIVKTTSSNGEYRR